MILTTPIWLCALAAIGIPVLIHLWNIRPGKTLKVGSISLFTESSPKSSRSFKLMDILLLILRCLMLVLLAIILTHPFWQQRIQHNRAKGWILVPQSFFGEAYHQFKPKIDSLSKAGYEFHYFNTGFAKQDLKELLKTNNQAKAKDTLNYWTLAAQLSGKIMPGTNAEIFTPNSISHFKGNKPQTALNINWHTFTSADSVSTWIDGAWLTPDNQIRIMQGTATPSGTTYQYTNIKNGSDARAYHVNIENGVPIVRPKNNVEDEVLADTSVQRIAVYTDKYQVDANYLKAALEAINQLTQRRVVIKQYNQVKIPVGQDWIFWLSDKPAAKELINCTKNLFRYENGKPSEVNTWLNGNNSIEQGQAKIALHKSISSTVNPADESVWADGFGHPMLTMQPGKTITYRFYSHFSPAWSDLVWSDVFPKWMLKLTQPPGHIYPFDKRAISAGQLQPVHIDSTDKNIPTPINTVDLTHYLWVILALLFVTERWLATRNKPILTNG